MASGSVGPDLSADRPTVLASWFCPFAQRTLIALTAKGAPYAHHEVSHDDLYSKPAWFTALSPPGLVPTLAWRGPDGDVRRLGESLIINEYIEEALPGPNALLPADPYDRARARMVAERFCSKAVPEVYRLLMRQDKESQEAAAAALSAQLEWLAAEGLHPEGPFALGATLSLVDCAVLPFLLRLPVLAHYRGYELPAAAAPRLRAYIAAAEAHPAVAATMKHPEGRGYYEALIESYARYADGTANSQVARWIRAEAPRPAAPA